jgi:hypothetical protein
MNINVAPSEAFASIYFPLFMAALVTLYTVIPLKDFKVSPVAGEPFTWLYVFNLTDNRKYKERIKIIGGVVSRNFNSPDFFTDLEFAMQRPVRDSVITLLLAGGVSTITADFLM